MPRARVAVCVSEKVSISTDHERILKDQGIGLYIATENGVLERIAPGDLGAIVVLSEYRQKRRHKFVTDEKRQAIQPAVNHS